VKNKCATFTSAVTAKPICLAVLIASTASALEIPLQCKGVLAYSANLISRSNAIPTAIEGEPLNPSFVVVAL
jgi:uncharacterized membrane protein